MSESSGPRKVTPQELLDIRERSWRPRARAVSLAAETLDEIPVHQREQALRALGRLYDRVGSGLAGERFLRRWPAVQVLATAGVAAEHYAKGTFWPKLTAIVNIDPDQSFQRDWGEAFLDNLGVLGLPTFENDDEAGSKYVGRILLHAGIPTYCLADFFKILSWKRSTTPGLTPEDFISWAASKAAGSGFTSVDMPVQRFIRYGDEFAVDVADRSFELLDSVAGGLPAEDVLLPQRFWAVAQELHEKRGLEQAADGRSIHGAAVHFKPRLLVDPFGQGLVLRLPPVGDAPDGKAIWVVTLDDEVRRVPTESLWPGSTEPAPQTDVPINRPVRSASIALAGREHLQLPMVIVDDQHPLLAFGEDGELIAQGLPLPAARTWMLFPGGLEALITTGPAPVLTESPLPPEWSGFCLVQLDLSDTSAVSVRGSVRTVRKFESARIEAANPVRGLRTASGLPVLARAPRVAIPKGMTKAEWDVTLHDSGGAVIARTRVTEDGDPNAIWDSIPRPIAGSFSIRVRGPWGRGASRSFTIVEGLSVSFSPGWRRFVQAGLQPCIAHLRAAGGVDLSRTQIEFGERDREQKLRVGVRGAAFSLAVSPPHMTVAFQAVGGSISPSVRPLSLTREQIVDCGGELILDVGEAAEPVLHIIAKNRLIQTIASRLGRAGVYRFDLGQLIDTIREHPQVSLALDPDGDLVIARVRPQSLFGRIDLVDGALQFSECVDVEGLTAYIFALRAPWRQPTPIAILHGRAELPEWLDEAGPLGVIARIEDPWIPLPAPGWLQAAAATYVEAEGWVIDEDHEEAAISTFLAGIAPLPAEIKDLSRLWTARALIPRLRLGLRSDEVGKAIDDVIYAHPTAALSALTDSEVPIELIPALMIRSGLAWANLAEAHESTAPPWSIRGALPAALLSAADSLWSDHEIDAAITICGDSVNGILDGNDPYATSGCLDESADLLDSNPELREQWVRTAGLVPQGLLSADSRVLAAMEFVQNRRHPSLQWLVANAHNVLREAERLVRIVGHPTTQAAFSARVHRTRDRGWHVVPAISMAYALAARHASRGHQEAGRWIVRQQRPWADLAEVAPQLATIDLIIAELTVGKREEAETNK